MAVMSKHERVYSTLLKEIRDGRFKPGARVPSEAQLVERFGVSRITVSRAMRDLQAAGLVHRRPGSGTYVSDSGDAGHSFGLLIPNLGESEIFEPMCQGMMASPLADHHALMWGNNANLRKVGQDRHSTEECAWQLCRQYIERKVSGVFFAPLEHTPRQDEFNQRIAGALQKARIPLVLLDRPLRPFPESGRHDLVGIDNRAAGYLVTDHLLRQGCRRLCFVSFAGAATTVKDRESGFREALYDAALSFEQGLLHRIDAEDAAAVESIMAAQKPDGIVCANDRTAARLLQSLRHLGVEIPKNVRLVGIDDVEYASLLPVPLTTLRQPARRLGEVALLVMLERVAHPELPAREVRLQCELIVRESCGARTNGVRPPPMH